MFMSDFDAQGELGAVMLMRKGSSCALADQGPGRPDSRRRQGLLVSGSATCQDLKLFAAVRRTGCRTASNRRY